ncbi:TPA: hypothetical protein SMF87_004559 [Serratia marcescens]|nr:hypothetical protein [Serratia marcescens]
MTNKITTTGTVRFMRSEEPGRCICCKGDHHIYCRPVDWDDGKSASRMIENLVASSEEMEGRRLRVTVEVVGEHAPDPEEALASITQRAHEQEGRADVAEDNLELARQRIAELEQLPTIKYMRSVEEALIRATDMVSELEKLLATPIRLPNKNDAEFWFGSTFQVAKFDRAVERAVSAAGFKFVGGE